MAKTEMTNVALLPRTLIHRTRWGTLIFWDRRHGLLMQDEADRLRDLTTDQLRRGYPEAWVAWLSFSAVLSPGDLARAMRPTDGHAA